MVEWFKNLNDAEKIAIVVPVIVAVIGGLLGLLKAFGKGKSSSTQKKTFQQKGSDNVAANIDGSGNTTNVAGRDILVQMAPTKVPKLVDAFTFGYSLIGAIAAEDNPALASQRELCLRGLELASKKLDIETSSIVKHATSIDSFLSDSEYIPLLRDIIREKYGNKASKAFEMAIWLAVSPLADDQSRLKALSHAEKHAQKIGLDKAYISRLFKEARRISDRLQFASKIPQFLTETLKQLETIQEKVV